MTHVLKKRLALDEPPFLLTTNGLILQAANGRSLQSTAPVYLVTEYIRDVSDDYLYDTQSDVDGYPLQAAPFVDTFLQLEDGTIIELEFNDYLEPE